MHITYFFSGMILLYSIIFPINGFSDQKLIYQSTTSGNTKKTEWLLTKEEDKILLNGKNPSTSIQMKCSPTYALLSYEEKTSPSKELGIVLEGPCLIITGKDDGKEKIKSFKIGKTPWVQEFKFGLQSFIQGKSKEYSFCIVNPKDLDLHDMIATKEIEEEITIAGQKYDTQRVKITLKGFKKNFWKAQVWFDKQTSLLVKYRSNEGPGTPYTETVLLEKS